MSWSFKYNNIDLSTYGLTLVMSATSQSALLSADPVQLQDREYVSSSLSPAKIIMLEVVVKAASTATLLSYIDSIKRICGQKEAGQLVLDILDDRYWTARFMSLNGQLISPYAFRGEITFSADDPLAYDVNTTTSGPHSITSGDITFDVVVGGTAYAKPVYTLTAGDALTSIALKVKNTDTTEEFSWGTGVAGDDVGNGHLFVIDSSLWYATNNAVSAMAKVTGQFPRLIPGATNHIKVTDFWDTNPGVLNIVYRAAYL